MSHLLKATPSSFQSLLFHYLMPQWHRALLMALLLLSSIGLQLANPQLLRYFIDTASATSDLMPLLLAGGLFVGLSLANQAISIWATYVSENVAWIATNELRSDLIAHCLRLDLAFHKAHTSGELIERIDGDVNTLSTFFSQAVVNLLGNSVLIVGILVLLFREDWRVGLALSVFALGASFMLTRLHAYAERIWQSERQQEAEFFGFLGEQIAGTEDMRANGATGYVMRRFYQTLQAWFPLARKAYALGGMMWSTTTILFAISNVIALSIGASLWSTRAISLGTVYLIFYYTNLLNTPMEQIRTQLQQLQQAGAGIQRVRQLLRTEPAISDGQGTMLPRGPLAVEFCNVSFGYNAADPILHHLNIHIQPGHVLGVLGRTGSGKTSLARLLLRLYDVQEGEICLSGVPLRAVSLRDLRQHIGIVTQDVQLFNASVRDNLTFFNPAISDERILAVLADLGLSTWYKALPEGLDTELGSNGEGLSAGEAQLLAFTRVFLADPGLVILDEASSRLDPATEQLIERAVSMLLEGRTGIVIAHRLATIQRADEIMIIEDGHVLEHDERRTLAANPASHFSRLLQAGLEEVRA